MSPLSPFLAIMPLLVAVATSFIIVRLFGSPPAQGRFVSIDGLRGYLAFCVFLHHSAVWYFYARTGRWENPDSNLFTHFGQSSVALFFMITGFLFFSKLIEARKKKLDWSRLYVTFKFMIGETRLQTFSPWTHWLIVMGLTPILIGSCFITFRLIENPGMRCTTPITNWLRRKEQNA